MAEWVQTSLAVVTRDGDGSQENSWTATGHSFWKERILFTFSLNQQIQLGLDHRTSSTFRVAVVCWPQGLTRMVPERFWTGTRPAGSAGEAGGWWLHNDTIGRVPGLSGGAIPLPLDGKSVTCMSLRLQPPSTDWVRCLWVLSTQPGPSCLSLLFHVYADFILYVHAFLCIFLRQFTDAQEKIIKADQPVRHGIACFWPPCMCTSGEHHTSHRK